VEDPLSSPLPSVPPYDLDILIALRKGKRPCIVHPIFKFVFYDRLNPSFHQFAMSLSSISILRSYEEAILVPAWKQTMDEEMNALVSRETWELISVPTNAIIV